MRKGDIIVYASCVSLAVLMAYVVNGRMQEKDYQYNLSVRESRAIIEQIGVDSFERLKAYHCAIPIATYIRTGQWTDKWCADKYQHLDFDLITKGEHEQH